MRARLLTIGLVLAALAASTPVAASPPGQQPLSVQKASLGQRGTQLVWYVQLAHPFSPTGLQRDGRSLCLLFERYVTGSVVGQACVAPPSPHGRVPRLVYMRITRSGPGRARVIDAVVTRSSTRDLTATLRPASVGLDYRPLRWQVISTLRPPACVPPVPDRVGCFTLYPAHPAVASLHQPLPSGCVPSGPPLAFNGPRSRRVVALTFDDGPWYDTPQFLDILEREHVHATFFQIGNQIGTYGAAVERRILADGDIIGDHTWDHATVSGDGPFAAAEISRAAAAIRQATGFQPCLFRAPGGGISSALVGEARRMGFTTIQWDVDPRDWSRPGTDAIYHKVVSNAHSGSIIIQHDGGGPRGETLAALPREIDTLRREGYQFVTVTDLLGQRLLYK